MTHNCISAKNEDGEPETGHVPDHECPCSPTHCGDMYLHAFNPKQRHTFAAPWFWDSDWHYFPQK